MTFYTIPVGQGSDFDRSGLLYPCQITDLNDKTIKYFTDETSDAVVIKQAGSYFAGPSANRPDLTEASGFSYFDTDLNKPIWYNGTKWVLSTGEDA